MYIFIVVYMFLELGSESVNKMEEERVRKECVAVSRGRM